MLFAFDDVVCLGCMDGCRDHIICNILPSETDIVPDASMEKHTALRYQTYDLCQFFFLVTAYILAVDQYFSLAGIIHMVEQVQNSRLTGAGAADDTNGSMIRHLKINIPDRHLARPWISKGYLLIRYCIRL